MASRRIVWTCWFQGLEQAPVLVRQCVQSWRDQNPGWDVRCLDASTIARYMDLREHVDLERQTITAASLSDIVRVLLLYEYGGVWADATCLCSAPLDDWLDQAAQSGFFAFAKPGEDRELATWFLAAAPGHPLLAKWATRALTYWRTREATNDYFWVHHAFGELLAVDAEARAQWNAVPRISADGPHSIQSAGMYEDYEKANTQVDWSAPVFKLTYRLEVEKLGPDTLLGHILARLPAAAAQPSTRPANATPRAIAQLSVGTENLGDHIQIIAGERMLARAGFVATRVVDRDHEIAMPPGEPTAILLNGWFKTNPEQWPPHPDYEPLYLGFHIRLFQSPSLVGPLALDNYRQHGPVGCRDRYTVSLLRQHGIDAFLSHCLTLTFQRRLSHPDSQTEVFVVSRDRRLLDFMPDSLGPTTFVSHYSGSGDFASNLDAARALLTTYRDKARLIVTTMLHCALPAIAMGIPVVVFYPPNEEPARRSDRERFSSLTDIVPVFETCDASSVDWRGYCPDVSSIKLALLDRFFAMAARWGEPRTPRVEGWAPASALPSPDPTMHYDYFNDPERLARLAEAKAPDRLKWGARSSYRAEWIERGRLAAAFITDGERVLEIGAGTGSFRDLVAGRCSYVGTDLRPVDPTFLTMDLETDPLPRGRWDAVVMLGVMEYVHDADAALAKVFATTSKVVMSYCCVRAGDWIDTRRRRGWVNDLDEAWIAFQAQRCGFDLVERAPLNETEDFSQSIFLLRRTND